MKHTALLLFLAGVARFSAEAAPLTCFAVPAGTPPARSNGLWEHAGDILLICIGGTPTPAGATVPKVDITVALAPAVNVTSRILSPNSSEALAILDEAPPAQQRACPAPVNCNLQGAASGNTGIDYANPGAASNGGQQVRNVYQADAPSGATVSIRGIPFDPPGDLAQRTVRIANVYFNAAQLGVPSGSARSLNATVSSSGGVNLNIQPGPLTIALAAEPTAFTLLDASGQPTAPVVLDRAAGNNTALASNPFANSAPQGRTFQVRLSETEFSSSVLRVRNGANWPDPNHEPDLVAQNQPGQIFFSETGFYNPAFLPAGGMRFAGLPTRGTRVLIRFSALPPGAKLFSPIRVLDATTGASLRRVFALDNGDSGPLFLPVFATSPVDGGIAPLAGCPADCHAVYEVTSADFTAFDNPSVPFYLAFPVNAAAGSASFRGTLAPTSTHGTAANLTAPRFAPPTAAPIPAFQIQ